MPKWSRKYIRSVIEERNAAHKRVPTNKVISITPNWQEKLAKHDFISKCKYEKFHF